MKTRIFLLGLWLLCLFSSLISLTWFLFAIVSGSDRAWRLAVSFDQVANTAFGGSEDETISSRAGKEARKGRRWACVLCKFLDLFEKGHCDKSIEADEGDLISTEQLK